MRKKIIVVTAIWILFFCTIVSGCGNPNLANCLDCGAKVSKRAFSCPECGRFDPSGEGKKQVKASMEAKRKQMDESGKALRKFMSEKAKEGDKDQWID